MALEGHQQQRRADLSLIHDHQGILMFTDDEAPEDLAENRKVTKPNARGVEMLLWRIVGVLLGDQPDGGWCFLDAGWGWSVSRARLYCGPQRAALEADRHLPRSAQEPRQARPPAIRAEDRPSETR